MKFTASISFWVKHYFSARNLVILVLLAIALLYGVHKGSIEYTKIIEDSADFIKDEDQLFRNFAHYEEYSIRGVGIFFQAASSCIYFSNPVLFSEVSGGIDSIFKININNDCKNRYILKGNSPQRFRFSDLVLVFAGLAVLLLGLDYFRYREFVRFLAANRRSLLVYIGIVFTGVILTACCFTVFLGLSLFMLKLKGIALTGNDFSGILIYLLTTSLVLILFFVLGSILGSIPSKAVRISGVLAVIVFLVFVLPTVFDSIIEEKAHNIYSSRHYDTKKHKIVIDFEDIYKKERGSAKKYTLEEARVIIGKYLREVFPKVEQEDMTERDKIAEAVGDYWEISILSPATFYTMTCQELSGRGYKSYLEFYDYLLDMRRRFVRFWIDRVYYHDPKEMVNFIKGDENVFKSGSRVPPTYWKGVYIQVGYILLFAVVSFLAFLFSLYYVDKQRLLRLGQADLLFGVGKLNVQLIKGDLLREALYVVLSGKTKRLAKKGFTASCVDAENNPFPLGRGSGIVYIPRVEEFPGDIRVNSLLVYYGRKHSGTRESITAVLSGKELQPLLKKKLRRLREEEKYWVGKAMVRLSRGKVYLIDDIIADASKEKIVEFKRELEELANRGIVVILLTAPRFFGFDVIPKGHCFCEGGAWHHEMASAEIEVRLMRGGGGVQGKETIKKEEEE